MQHYINPLLGDERALLSVYQSSMPLCPGREIKCFVVEIVIVDKLCHFSY